MTNRPVFPAFLLEREIAGQPREALMAVFPRHLWPEAWTTPDDVEPVQDQETDQ